MRFILLLTFSLVLAPLSQGYAQEGAIPWIYSPTMRALAQNSPSLGGAASIGWGIVRVVATGTVAAEVTIPTAAIMTAAGVWLLEDINRFSPRDANSTELEVSHDILSGIRYTLSGQGTEVLIGPSGAALITAWGNHLRGKQIEHDFGVGKPIGMESSPPFVLKLYARKKSSPAEVGQGGDTAATEGEEGELRTIGDIADVPTNEREALEKLIAAVGAEAVLEVIKEPKVREAQIKALVGAATLEEAESAAATNAIQRYREAYVRFGSAFAGAAAWMLAQAGTPIPGLGTPQEIEEATRKEYRTRGIRRPR